MVDSSTGVLKINKRRRVAGSPNKMQAAVSGTGSGLGLNRKLNALMVRLSKRAFKNLLIPNAGQLEINF